MVRSSSLWIAKLSPCHCSRAHRYLYVKSTLKEDQGAAVFSTQHSVSPVTSRTWMLTCCASCLQRKRRTRPLPMLTPPVIF
ncbi:hypothetical protein M514_28425 [Trichuris suis]|uniref:Uncharacterized protein n=1 Tax=Trichuris suis TaxID=68888 RepID=A0A085MQA0_9BILA|nr:hypothetical protein M514_28425 [Trichuris suis]